MKFYKIIISLLTGLFAILLEFQSSIKGDLMGGQYIFKYFLILVLLVLAIIYFIQGFRTYRNSKEAAHFFPFITCFILLAIIYGHMDYRDTMDNSESAFKAYGVGKIEGREYTEIDFKKNGYLLIRVGYKFTSDYSCGSYSKKGDTLILNIKTRFKLPKKAIIEGKKIRFLGDSTQYRLTIASANMFFLQVGLDKHSWTLVINFIKIFSISSGPVGRNSISQPAKSPVR